MDCELLRYGFVASRGISYQPRPLYSNFVVTVDSSPCLLARVTLLLSCTLLVLDVHSTSPFFWEDIEEAGT